MEIFKNLGGDLFSCIVGGIIIFFVLILKEFVTWGIQKRKQDSETDIDLVNEFRKTNIALEDQSEKIEEIRNSLELIQRSLESLEEIAKLYEKYRLPSKEDRNFIDETKMDEEFRSYRQKKQNENSEA